MRKIISIFLTLAVAFMLISCGGKKSSETYFIEGSKLLKAGKNEEALLCFEQAAKMNPRYAAAFFYKGNAQMALGRDMEALQSYERSIQLDPNLAPAHFNRGNLLVKMGEYPTAIEAYDNVIHIDPSHIKAYYNKALALRKMGRDKEADEVIAQAGKAPSPRPQQELPQAEAQPAPAGK